MTEAIVGYADPKDGDRFVVTTNFEAIVMVQFAAPVSDGRARRLPVGLVFEIWGDPVPAAGAVSARPVDPERWLGDFVGGATARSRLYGGYSLVIPKSELARSCKSMSPID